MQKQVITRDYNYRTAMEDMNTSVDATRGAATTYGYQYADNCTNDRNPAPESGVFYARIRYERYLSGQTQYPCHHLLPGPFSGSGTESHRRV